MFKRVAISCSIGSGGGALFAAELGIQIGDAPDRKGRSTCARDGITTMEGRDGRR